MDIKLCRSRKCSSDSACKSEYYSALNYAMDDVDVVEGCTLDGSQYAPPAETPVDQCGAKELIGRSEVSSRTDKTVIDFFNENP